LSLKFFDLFSNDFCVFLQAYEFQHFCEIRRENIFQYTQWRDDAFNWCRENHQFIVHNFPSLFSIPHSTVIYAPPCSGKTYYQRNYIFLFVDTDSFIPKILPNFKRFERIEYLSCLCKKLYNCLSFLRKFKMEVFLKIFYFCVFSFCVQFLYFLSTKIMNRLQHSLNGNPVDALTSRLFAIHNVTLSNAQPILNNNTSFVDRIFWDVAPFAPPHVVPILKHTPYLVAKFLHIPVSFFLNTMANLDSEDPNLVPFVFLLLKNILRLNHAHLFPNNIVPIIVHQSQHFQGTLAVNITTQKPAGNFIRADRYLCAIWNYQNITFRRALVVTHQQCNLNVIYYNIPTLDAAGQPILQFQYSVDPTSVLQTVGVIVYNIVVKAPAAPLVAPPIVAPPIAIVPPGPAPIPALPVVVPPPVFVAGPLPPVAVVPVLPPLAPIPIAIGIGATFFPLLLSIVNFLLSFYYFFLFHPVILVFSLIAVFTYVFGVTIYQVTTELPRTLQCFLIDFLSLMIENQNFLLCLFGIISLFVLFFCLQALAHYLNAYNYPDEVLITDSFYYAERFRRPGEVVVRPFYGCGLPTPQYLCCLKAKTIRVAHVYWPLFYLSFLPKPECEEIIYSQFKNKRMLKKLDCYGISYSFMSQMFMRHEDFSVIDRKSLCFEYYLSVYFLFFIKNILLFFNIFVHILLSLFCVWLCVNLYLIDTQPFSKSHRDSNCFPCYNQQNYSIKETQFLQFVGYKIAREQQVNSTVCVEALDIVKIWATAYSTQTIDDEICPLCVESSISFLTFFPYYNKLALFLLKNVIYSNIYFICFVFVCLFVSHFLKRLKTRATETIPLVLRKILADFNHSDFALQQSVYSGYQVNEFAGDHSLVNPEIDSYFLKNENFGSFYDSHLFQSCMTNCPRGTTMLPSNLVNLFSLNGEHLLEQQNLLDTYSIDQVAGAQTFLLNFMHWHLNHYDISPDGNIMMMINSMHPRTMEIPLEILMTVKKIIITHGESESGKRAAQVLIKNFLIGLISAPDVKSVPSLLVKSDCAVAVMRNQMTYFHFDIVYETLLKY
jgi:hypothetical protein